MTIQLTWSKSTYPEITICNLIVGSIAFSRGESVFSHLRCYHPADTFEKSLNAGFVQATDYVEIWHTYLDYLRRRVDFSKGKGGKLHLLTVLIQ